MRDSEVFAGIVGQRSACAVLSARLGDGRIPSAYLFDGPEGCGKFRVALEFCAAAIGATEAERARVLAQAHPDVRVFAAPEGSHNLPIEVIREEILPFSKFAPFEARRAFVIFRDAEACFPEQHAQGANALLKTIEEPRPNVHFIFVADRATRLLPTIRSRCQRVSFHRLADREVEQILSTVEASEPERKLAVALAQGSVARARRLLEAGTEALAEKALGMLEGLPGNFLGLAEALSKEDDPATLLHVALLLLHEANCDTLGVPKLPEQVHTRFPTLRALKPARGAEEWLIDALDALQANGSPELVFADLALRWSEGLRPQVRRRPLER